MIESDFLHSAGYTAASFRVPKRYLSLLLGEQAAARLLSSIEEDADGDGLISSVSFLKLCLERMRETNDESYGIVPRSVAPIAAPWPPAHVPPRADPAGRAGRNS